MKTSIKTILITAILLFTSIVLSAQASLTIENNSKRTMTVKVMNTYNGIASLYRLVSITAYSSETVYFSSSGYYFTKTKAVLDGKDPIYRKGESFHVINNSSGYSEMTLTFTIVESSVPQATGGKSISKTEFDQN
jgi:hypothetical protein